MDGLRQRNGREEAVEMLADTPSMRDESHHGGHYEEASTPSITVATSQSTTGFDVELNDVHPMHNAASSMTLQQQVQMHQQPQRADSQHHQSFRSIKSSRKSSPRPPPSASDKSRTRRNSLQNRFFEGTQGLSRQAIRIMQMLADFLFAICLLVSFCVRVNLVSLLYWMVFCYGVIYSFESRKITLLVLLVSTSMLIGDIAIIGVAQSKGKGWELPSQSIFELVGFFQPNGESPKNYLTSVGVEALVTCCASFHMFYVLRKLGNHRARLDLFQIGQQMMNWESQRLSNHKESTLLWVQSITVFFMFVCALAVPAFASGVYYLILLERLFRWTFKAKQVKLEHLVNLQRNSNNFLGNKCARLLLGLNLLFMLLMYLYQFPQLHNYDGVFKAGEYAGFVVFAASSVNWSNYVFVVSQLVLFLSVCRLFNIFKEVEKHREDLASPSLNSILQRSNGNVNVQEILQKQPLLVRIFLSDGSLLLASAAAIFWCTSYPSYLSAPFCAWAFFTLAVYGLGFGLWVAHILVIYGTLMGMTEFFCNMVVFKIITSRDLTAYGLRRFDYPFLELGAHHIALFFIYLSIRTRLRYRDLLREASNQQTKQRRPSSTSEQNTRPDSLTQQTDMRLQMQHGWKQLLGLWVKDAKHTILSHLDALVLLTILAVVLSTKVSFIQVGYLVLAVALMLFFAHRRRFWRVLLVYALMACLAVFVRNVDCTPDARLDLWGLPCYDSDSFTWSSLWPTLFSAQLLIITQLVFQLVIYVANKDSDLHKNVHQVRQYPIYFLSRLGVEMDNCFRIAGVIVCYIAFLVVALSFERGLSTKNTNWIGALQLMILCFLLGSHLARFPYAPRTSWRLRLWWGITLVIEVSILVIRYVYQFDDVSSYIKKNWIMKEWQPEDFGLQKMNTEKNLSSLFLYLIPTAVLMAFTFWQMISLMRDVYVYDFFTAGQSRAIDNLRYMVETLQKTVLSCSTLIMLIVTMAIALNHVNAVGALYLLTLVLGRMICAHWRHLWYPLFWISSLALLAKFLSQLSVFSRKSISISSWLRENGIWIYGNDNVDGHMWSLVEDELWVIFVCCLQRVAMYFDQDASKRRRAKSPKPSDVRSMIPRKSGRFDSDQDGETVKNTDMRLSAEEMESPAQVRRDSIDRVSIEPTKDAAEEDDDYADEDDDTEEAHDHYGEDLVEITSGRGKRMHKLDQDAADSKKFALKRFQDSLIPVLSHVDEDETAFLTSLREFCVGYASKASVNVVTLVLVISAFLHDDAVAVIYMVVVYSMMYARAESVCRVWWLLVVMLSMVMIGQYALMLWLPPFFDVDINTTSPWNSMSESYLQWLLLRYQHKWALMSDYIALMCVYLLPKSSAITYRDSSIETPRAVSLVNDSTEYVDASQPHVAVLDIDVEQAKLANISGFIALTRRSAWHFLEYLFATYWLLVVLIAVFIFGAVYGGIISAVYLGMSIYMLLNLETARAPECKLIHHLRRLNWLHLFLMLVLQAPYVNDKVEDCQFGSGHANATSAGKTVAKSCFSMANIMGVSLSSKPVSLIAMFVLLSIQCELAACDIYRDVYDYLRQDIKEAGIRKEELDKEYYRKRTARWIQFKREKSSAIQRLKLIVSKLVHKVEELMDIAMGMHYNLPPTAPSQPVFVDKTQNSVTVQWRPPQHSQHRVRYYRISRQRFPSMTLLGEFSDIVEVKGTNLQARIEGLRPGTSYQFKVCAVNRMGEGPFSVASEPISTFPLNLEGSCTAGWMKYRRISDPAPRGIAYLMTLFHAKYLQRYVVMDKKRLVYYKDEEAALKHRSKKRHRKKIKTCIFWRDVLSLKLSENKVQYDDLSPSLHCFEVIVQHKGRRGKMKYTFQPEVAKEFDMFLNAFAWSVPRDAIGENIIACLVQKNLRNPLEELALLRNAAEDEPLHDDQSVDESTSEWSSVTGDESTLGDLEDAEFDAVHDKQRFAWRLILYRFLYKLQNAAFQFETTCFEEDDPEEPWLSDLIQVFANVIRSYTAQWTYIVFIIAFIAQADLLNMVYVFALFGYLLVDAPRPSPRVWAWLLNYTFCILGIRYAYQLSFFCQQVSTGRYLYPSFQPFCASQSGEVVTTLHPFQPMVLFGIYKFDGIATSVDSIVNGLLWDFYIVLFLLWHRKELLLKGLWIENDGEADGMGAHDHESQLNLSFMSSRDSIDDSFGGDTPKPDLQVASPQQRVLGVEKDTLKTDQKEKHKERESDGGLRQSSFHTARQVSTGQTSLSFKKQRDRDLAAEALDALKEEAEKQDAVKARAEEDEETPRADALVQPEQLKALAQAEEEHRAAEQEAMVQAEAFDLSEHNKKLSWMEEKFPRLYDYLYRQVLVKPPPNWDKDIHAAIEGTKPGRDFYAPSLTMMLFSLIYALVFFKNFGEPTATSAGDLSFSQQSSVASSSMFSGYMVLVVLTQLILILWDRAAHVCASLYSKLILQMVYVIVLHLGTWYLIPLHSQIYFQNRGALVFFYLQHCVVLWFGGLQLKYGYPVFRGSKYHYEERTLYRNVTEKVFPLIMMAPFLFEMRALLDYLCTKTSLSSGHWLLLEETAAHLYMVKIEMQKRVADAKVLQGNARQPFLAKFLAAGLLLLALLVCLVGPLALFSSANPSTKPNGVTLAQVVFGVKDASDTLITLYTNSESRSPLHNPVQKLLASSTAQKVSFASFAHDIWTTSPPDRMQLTSKLNSTQDRNDLRWTIKFSFDRPAPADHLHVETEFFTYVTSDQRAQLIAMISQNSSTSNVEPIAIKNLFPVILQLSPMGDINARTKERLSVNVTKQILDGVSWWNVIPVDQPGSTTDNKEIYCEETKEMMCIVTVSDNVVEGLNALGIGSYGITAVYVFVLVTIGNFVRQLLRGALFKVIFSELPDPQDMLELIEGIYIARVESYVGHLKDEVRIFETLIRVLRSPETLTKVTGINVIHIPTAKEKVE